MLSEWVGGSSGIRSLAEDGSTTIARVMAEVQPSGTHEVRFCDAQGKDHCAVLSVRHATMTVRPPIGKQRKYRHQTLQIIHAEELDPPVDRAPVIWKLITNLPVATHADAVHKLLWLPPVMQEVLILSACDRVRTFVRPQYAAFPKAAGRDGDQRIRSKSRMRAHCTKLVSGFPNPDPFDLFAHSGHLLLTLPFVPTRVRPHDHRVC